MSEVQMEVKLLAHTQLSDEFVQYLWPNYVDLYDGQVIALTAIRTCYSSIKPFDIVTTEGDKYFSNAASDGKGGTESDRLFRHIIASGHTSTLEHLTFTFAIEGVSRALLAQLTRHRVGFSFSVQSQRYVKLGSGDKSGGFDYVVPETIVDPNKRANFLGREGSTYEIFRWYMERVQEIYDTLREAGVPAEDARAVLPNATATNLTMTVNLRALLDFYSKRRKGNGAQHEITVLAERLRECVVEVEPWTDQFFEGV